MTTEGGNNNRNCSLEGHSEVVRIIQIQSRAQPQKRQSACYSKSLRLRSVLHYQCLYYESP